jgi:hypothetical protein
MENLNDDQQARLINNYENSKYKTLKTNAGIWLNKTCRNDQLTPKHANINIKDNQRNESTKIAAVKYKQTPRKDGCERNVY